MVPVDFSVIPHHTTYVLRVNLVGYQADVIRRLTKTSSNRGIDSLDQRHLMSIILFIHENGPSGKIEIYDAVSRNASMPKRLGALMELNILDSDGNLFSLTEIGRDIAIKLSDIEDRLAMDHRP